MRKQKVAESALLAPGKLILVLWVDLEAQVHAQHKRGDARNESGQERVERECSDQTAIHELNDASEEAVSEICVDQFQFHRSCFLVVDTKFGDNSAQFGCFGRHFG